MAGIHAQPVLACNLGSLHKWCHRCFWVFSVSTGVRLCVQLNTVGASLGGIFNHLWVGADKDAGADAKLSEVAHDVRKEFKVCFCVPTAV